MSPSAHGAGVENPFDARYVRPGAIRFLWPTGQSPETLLARLEQNGWQGQIVGPHGSGKSALVAWLIEEIQRAGRRAVLVELHDGQRHLPVSLRGIGGSCAGAVLIVDGYEQLSCWSRFLLRRHCRRRKLGLVVTAHASAGFPDLLRTAAGLDLAVRVVRELLGDRSLGVTDDEIGRLFERRQGNLRELLFDLYDLYERQRQGGNASSEVTAF